ncbi:hypothetical protein VCHC44C1_1628A, partial [Vibrio cholerae HC-44C1]
MSSGQR